MIYTITCLEKIEESKYGVRFGSSAFMGYYFDKETALQAARENWCDIAERLYNYAVVEEIPEGLYAYPHPGGCFKYDIENDKFYPIMFNYAVVEEIPEGLYAFPRTKWYFKYDPEEDIFNPIDEPKAMEHIANVL